MNESKSSSMDSLAFQTPREKPILHDDSSGITGWFPGHSGSQIDRYRKLEVANISSEKTSNEKSKDFISLPKIFPRKKISKSLDLKARFKKLLDGESSAQSRPFVERSFEQSTLEDEKCFSILREYTLPASVERPTAVQRSKAPARLKQVRLTPVLLMKQEPFEKAREAEEGIFEAQFKRKAKDVSLTVPAQKTSFIVRHMRTESLKKARDWRLGQDKELIGATVVKLAAERMKQFELLLQLNKLESPSWGQTQAASPHPTLLVSANLKSPNFFLKRNKY